MLPLIEKLLVLQDRDRRLNRLREELAHIPAERRQLEGRTAQNEKNLADARQQAMHLESERKRLELEVEAKKGQIEKYAVQQFQTRKNEEFRALGHEIETARKEIFEIENQILDLMEQSERAQGAIKSASKEFAESKQMADELIARLNERELNLRKELAEVENSRAALAEGVEEQALARYERLQKSKGGNAIVGIERGVCGGCHMRLSRQLVVDCRAEQALVNCLNCGRLLYYTADMDVAVED